MFGRKKRIAESSTEVVTPDGLEVIEVNGLQSETAALVTIGKLFDVYRPGVVFSEPTTIGDNTVITAAEVSVGMGLGFGRGSGGEADNGGEGRGGGGGGGSMGRPVAAIIITPKGVQVEPIVDITKIAIAFFTTIGAIYMAWRSMRRQSK